MILDDQVKTVGGTGKALPAIYIGTAFVIEDLVRQNSNNVFATLNRNMTQGLFNLQVLF